MTSEEFLKLLGEIPHFEYDDAVILQARNRRKRLTKERLKDAEARAKGIDQAEKETKPRKHGKKKHKKEAAKNE